MRGRLFCRPARIFNTFEILSFRARSNNIGNLLRIARKAGDSHGDPPRSVRRSRTAAVSNGERQMTDTPNPSFRPNGAEGRRGFRLPSDR